MLSKGSRKQPFSDPSREELISIVRPLIQCPWKKCSAQQLSGSPLIASVSTLAGEKPLISDKLTCRPLCSLSSHERSEI